MSKIRQIGSLSDLERAVSGGQISVVDCFATWCGPCKAIAPVFERLSNAHSPPVQFLKVDVDASPDVARKYSVSAMPTFLVLRGTEMIDSMRGADPAGLERLVLKHLPAARSSSTSAAAAAAAAGPVEKGLEGFTSLLESIDQSQLSCLNESSEHTLRNLIKRTGPLVSDADEQLLLNIPLNQSTKIRAIRFGTRDQDAATKAPKTVRLFVNRPTIGFDDADSLEPAQEVELNEQQASGKEAVQLRFVRFQNVNALSIFVKDNQGNEDVTRIDSFDLLGLASERTDVSKLQKQSDE